MKAQQRTYAINMTGTGKFTLVTFHLGQAVRTKTGVIPEQDGHIFRLGKYIYVQNGAGVTIRYLPHELEATK